MWMCRDENFNEASKEACVTKKEMSYKRWRAKCGALGACVLN